MGAPLTGVRDGDSALGPGGARINSLRVTVIFLVGMALTVMIPFVEHVYLYSLVTVLAACVAVPMWLDWNRKKLDLFAPIHVFGGLYFIYFGLGSIWTVQDPGRVAYDLHLAAFVPEATLYCVIGYMALLVGYYLPWSRRPMAAKGELWPRGVAIAMVTGGLGFTGYLAIALWTRATWVGRTLPGIVGSLGQLYPLFLMAWALAWLLFFAKKDSPRMRAILFGLLIPGTGLIIFLTVSMKALLMVLLGIPAVARWYVSKRVPWLALISLFVILVFIVFPLYNTFRWQDASLDQGERLERTYRSVQDWTPESYQLFSTDTVKRRMAMINSVAIVVRDVGRWVPYAKGETLFVPLVTYFIPRVVWPDKPVQQQGREFGRRFRITNYLSRETHIGATIPGELYWNFDLPGVIVGMTLIGMGMRWIYRRYGESPALDPIRRAIYIAMLVQIAHLGGSLAPSIVGMVRALILIEIICWIGRRYGMIETRSSS